MQVETEIQFKFTAGVGENYRELNVTENAILN